MIDMEKIILEPEQSEQLHTMHIASGADYSALINSAINELYKSLNVQLKRLNIKDKNLTRLHSKKKI